MPKDPAILQLQKIILMSEKLLKIVITIKNSIDDWMIAELNMNKETLSLIFSKHPEPEECVCQNGTVPCGE
jgi:hypothetical protein